MPLILFLFYRYIYHWSVVMSAMEIKYKSEVYNTFCLTIVHWIWSKHVAGSCGWRVNFPPDSLWTSRWLLCFSLCTIQTWVTVLSGELMFILGSQIPTFPNRAWLTWKSTDAFFIPRLQSLRTNQKQLKRWERVFFFFFFLSAPSFCRVAGDAACILTTCPLYPLHCIQFTLIDFLFSVLPRQIRRWLCEEW